MASKLECKKVGDTITMHCMRCEVVESSTIKNKDGTPQEQVKFTDTRGDYLFLPREAADRQLGRMGFVDGELVIYGDVDGNTLLFSRTPNKKRAFAPYWNVELVTPPNTNRPSLTEAAKHEAERVRKAKGLPAEDDGNTIGKLPFDDAPPPTDADSPYGDDEMPPVKATAHPKLGTSLKETEINAAYDRAWNHALTVQGGIGTAESVQAGAATLLIAYGKSGIV